MSRRTLMLLALLGLATTAALLTGAAPRPADGPQWEYASYRSLGNRYYWQTPDAEVFVSLNATAGDVWRLATGELIVDEIVARLASSYEVAPDSIRDDVVAAVDRLVEAGLLQTQR